MASIKKVAVALAVALGAHAAVLVYGVAPRVEGLAGRSEDGPELPADEPAEISDADRSIDIGFGESPEPAAPAQVEPAKPQLAEVAKAVPAPRPAPPVAKPEPKPAPPAKPAAPVTAAKPAPKPAAAKPAAPAAARGAGGGTAATVTADAGYANRVRQHLGRYAGALPPGAVGEARVQFVVQPDGRVTEVQLVKRSGSAALDALALNLPVQAQPLPLPGAVPQRLEVPLQVAAPAP